MRKFGVFSMRRRLCAPERGFAEARVKESPGGRACSRSRPAAAPSSEHTRTSRRQAS